MSLLGSISFTPLNYSLEFPLQKSDAIVSLDLAIYKSSKPLFRTIENCHGHVIDIRFSLLLPDEHLYLFIFIIAVDLHP